jgi:DHA2 family multidrug resistance protein-like MFS transporter
VAAVRQSVFGGVAVASKLHSPALLTSVHRAFVHGMDMALLVSAGIALVGVVLTILFLPQTNVSKKPLKPGMDTEGEGVRNRPLTTSPAA